VIETSFGHLSARAKLPGIGAIAISALVLTASLPASAQTLGPLIKVTGGSVFKRCTADKVKQQELIYGGLVYRNIEIEPYVAVNPLNPLNQIVVTQQDRWSNGGSRGTRGALTKDGGKTWTASVPVGVSPCDGGPYRRSSDPWVSVAPNGVVFFSSLVDGASPIRAERPGRQPLLR
jgi:hypothetical protein